MEWTDLHGRLLAEAFESVLGDPQPGAMAFARCLTPGVIEALGSDTSFAPAGWQVLRVSDEDNAEKRTITADRAVERREAKGEAVLLLVDTEHAGAGMDGIYSAAREVDEAALFQRAQRLAGGEITRRLSAASRRYAEQAIKKARGRGGLHALSRWAEFDFLCRVAAGGKSPGAYLHLLGLWPIRDSDDSDAFNNDLNTSRMFRGSPAGRVRRQSCAGRAHRGCTAGSEFGAGERRPGAFPAFRGYETVARRVGESRGKRGPVDRRATNRPPGAVDPGHRAHSLAKPERDYRQVVRLDRGQGGGGGEAARLRLEAGRGPERPLFDLGGQVEGRPGPPREECGRIPRHRPNHSGRGTGRSEDIPLRAERGREMPVQQR